MSIAELTDLTVTYGGSPAALDDVTLHLDAGQVHAVIGESGAGKSTLAAALIGALPAHAHTRGRVQINATAGHVPQHAARSFTPVRHLRGQLEEIARAHRHMTAADAARAVDLGQQLLDRYPHQLSGGQARRAALAAALLTGAGLIVADEPTAGLDGPAAADLMRLLRGVADAGRAVVIVSHDWPALAQFSRPDTVTVLRGGTCVHQGPAALVDAATDAYTALLAGRGPRHELAPTMQGEGALAAHAVTARYGRHAVFDDYSLAVPAAHVTALSAPSGSGKTTLIRLLSGLSRPDAGRVELNGRALPAKPRGDIAVVWQDPAAALDPRLTVRRSIALTAHRGARRAGGLGRYAEAVGLDPQLLERTPGRLSGGQLQRAALAKALAQRPRYLLCDEPTAHLDPVNAATVLEGVAAFAAGGGGALVASHDVALVDAYAHTHTALPGVR